MAPKSPRAQAMIDERTARVKVVQRASVIAWLLKRATYHFRVKPPQTTLDLESLKLNMTSTAMGAYKKIMSSAIYILPNTRDFFTG